MRQQQYTASEASKILGLSEWWIRKRIRSGEIAATALSPRKITRAEIVRLCVAARMSPEIMRFRLREGNGVVACAYRELGPSVAGCAVTHCAGMFEFGRLIESGQFWLGVLNVSAEGIASARQVAGLMDESDRPTVMAVCSRGDLNAASDAFDFAFPVDTQVESVAEAIGRIKRSEM